MNIKPPVPTEAQEQRALVNWFRLQFPEVLIFAIPNGGKRNTITAARLKAEGVVAGVPDLYVPEWRLWVEMKRQKGGRLSDKQIKCRDYLLGIGDRYILGLGFDDAKSQIMEISKRRAA